MIVRRLARPMLAAVLVWEGVDTMRDPQPRVDMATPLLSRMRDKAGSALPEWVPTEPASLVTFDAIVKVVAGSCLAFGILPRVAAVVLVASMVPTTLAGHSFWEHEDPEARRAHRTQALKNLGLIGGLLLAAVDTEGRPPRR